MFHKYAGWMLFALCVLTGGLVLSYGQVKADDSLLPDSDTLTMNTLPIALQAEASRAIGASNSVYHVSRNRTLNNPAQVLQATFTPEHVVFQKDTHHWTVRLSGTGYGNTLQSAALTTLQTIDNRVNYQRGSVTEWYVNGPRGIQQGITIHTPPAAGSGQLTAAFSLGGNLTPVQADNSLELHDAAGNRVFTYSGLIAFDANGRDLPVQMTVQGNELLLRADDTDAVYPVTIDPFVETAQLTPLETSDRYFGGQMAAEGNTIAILSAGEAYVFVNDNGIWTQQAYLQEDPVFGSTIDISGDTLIISSHPGTFDGSYDSGNVAYIFVREGTTWTKQATLTSIHTDYNDWFGSTVVIDGDVAVVGAPREDSAFADDPSDNSYDFTGAAYVFVRENGVWRETQYLKKTPPRNGEIFSHQMALEGNNLMIGASGQVYFFKFNGTIWEQQQTLILPIGVGAVAIDNDTFVVTYTLADTFSYRQVGKAMVYVLENGLWTHQDTLMASNSMSLLKFGKDIDIEGDTIVVTSDGLNSLYVFIRKDGRWYEESRIRRTAEGDLYTRNFGNAVEINGDTVFVGASAYYRDDPAQVHVFELVPSEMQLTGNGMSITNGDTTPASDNLTDFGQLIFRMEPQIHTFTIHSTGEGPLDIAQIETGSSYYFPLTASTPMRIPAGESATFDITFNPHFTGVFRTQVEIMTSDRPNTPYTFLIQGQTLPIAEITDYSRNPMYEEDSNEILSIAVSLRGRTDRITTVQYQTVNGTATAGEDYVANSGTITFPAHTSRQFIDIVINNDDIAELDETFSVVISDPSHGILGEHSEANITIVTDEITEMAVRGNGYAIPRSSRGWNDVSREAGTEFGTNRLDLGAETRSFTIENTGNVELVLADDAPITTTDSNFTVTRQPAETRIPPGGTTSFEVSFTRTVPGNSLAMVEILTNISDRPYQFTVGGTMTTLDLNDDSRVSPTDAMYLLNRTDYRYHTGSRYLDLNDDGNISYRDVQVILDNLGN